MSNTCFYCVFVVPRLQTTYPLSCTCRRLEETTYQACQPWRPPFTLKRENHSAEFQTVFYLSRHRWIRRAFTVVMCSKPSEPWNYLSLFKVFNFKQRLWLAKRKTNWHVARNVAYCPTLPSSAIGHLRRHHVHNMNRSLHKTYWH